MMLGIETFTSAGAPWVPQEWLFSVFVAIAMQHGIFPLFAFLVSGIPALTLASIATCACVQPPVPKRSRPCYCCAESRSRNRSAPERKCWAGLSSPYSCSFSSGAIVGSAIPIAVISANLHAASVMIAPAIVLARIVGGIADRGWQDSRNNRDLRIFLPVLFATFCTPLGWHLPIYALMLVGSPIRHFIEEWRAPN